MKQRKAAIPEIELDLGRYELRRQGRRVKLEKKPMELLIFLVSRREQMVTRQEIVTKLWKSDLFVDTETSINNIVRKVRTALGDSFAKPRFLETVVGKGYRLVGPLRVIDAQHGPTASESGTASENAGAQAGVWNERSALAVMPMTVVGNATDDHGISLGIADALTTRLGNLQGVDVMPVSAVLKVPAEMATSETAARLGVRFLVRGGIQMTKGRWRLSLEVFDAHRQSACYRKKCDLDVERLTELEGEIAKQIAAALNRSLGPTLAKQRPRHSKDPMAYAEFMRGYRLSSLGEPRVLDEAAQHLSNAVMRDPGFSLAHATLSFVYATKHFEVDPGSVWLEKAEFHCEKALELDADLAEGHVANAFLLWGQLRNFQHIEAINELKRALTLQNNQPHAYNRLGTILAHVGLLEHAREMYKRGGPFHPKKTLSHSVVQVYVWNQEYDAAMEEIQAWRAESPRNKYPLWFGPQPAMMTGNLKEAKMLLDEAIELLPDEPMIISLQGVFAALSGDESKALECLTKTCANPKSFGHAHHSYYQVACILALLGRRETAFEWLERSVSSGFACWPFFMKDPCLKNLRGLSSFDVLVSSLQAKYPDHLGLL